MNKSILVGRLTADPEIKTTTTDTKFTRFTLAVDRRFKRDGEQTADFISCVSFGKTAEFICEHMKKGRKLGAVGRIQTGSYTNKDGNKVYTTDVVVEEAYFVESKNTGTQNEPPIEEPPSAPDGWINIPDGIDADLPFA